MLLCGQQEGVAVQQLRANKSTEQRDGESDYGIPTYLLGQLLASHGRFYLVLAANEDATKDLQQENRGNIVVAATLSGILQRFY